MDIIYLSNYKRGSLVPLPELDLHNMQQLVLSCSQWLNPLQGLRNLLAGFSYNFS